MLIVGWRAVPLLPVLCSAGGGEDRIHRAARLVCRSVVACAPGQSRGLCLLRGCPGSRVSGMGGAAFGGFLVAFGSCPAGGHRFPESRWRPLGVCFMSVSKLCGSLCSGAPRVRSGRRAVQAEHVAASSVFEHVWQSAMPPLPVLLQGSTSSQMLLESVCCTPAFSDARACPVIGAPFLEVWVGVWLTRGAPINRAFARLTWIYTYRA